MFHIPDSEIEEIRSIIKQSRKAIRNYEVNVLNQDNGIIATVYKELYIRAV
ncbi:MAG: hypothetical protein ABIK15_12050 [Pseudomonadota bacterium]